MAKKKTAKAPATASLLVELLTEELPPKSLRSLSERFLDGLKASLASDKFIGDDAAAHAFATPRRLAVVIEGVRERSPEKTSVVQGPSVNLALDANGKPSLQLLGFARKLGVAVEQLERGTTAKGEAFFLRTIAPEIALETVMAQKVETVLKSLSIPKTMRWGDNDVQFVRPVHGVVVLHGSKIIPGEVFRLKSGNKTLGHRFLSRGWITIKRAADYEQALHTQGKVIASFEKRREGIVHELDRAVAKLKTKGTTWHLGKDKELDVVDEVAGIVESPHVYVGEFDSAFLDLPRECLILSMQQHQKYFPLEAGNGRLLPQFLFVSNTHPTDARQIIHGNERVLRARLADARFFFDQDRKTKLEDRVERLKNVVYHNKLGSQYDRVLRIKKLAVEIAHRIEASTEVVGRAAYLSKADLLTEMVGEFPELQGIMGREYAFHEGKADIATTIYEHYLPRFAGDDLPNSAVSISVALADKLDTLVGIYGIGLIPTGDKDPFGLRRQALGVVRILVERASMLPALDIKELLQLARSKFLANTLTENVDQGVYDFMVERLRSYLREKNLAPDEIDSVLALNPTRLNEVLPRIEAIKKFRALPEGMALSAANKRIRNILRQAKVSFDGVANPDLLKEDAERDLYREVVKTRRSVEYEFSTREYTKSLIALACLRPYVDRFFEEVLVNVDDAGLRDNRLRLLGELAYLMSRVADISKLAA